MNMLKMSSLNRIKINLKLVLRLGFVIGVSLFFFLIKPLLTPPGSLAQTPVETNTDVFTGQIVPSFFASEYDPTEAFKSLAGASVYVFAYDTWGSNSMVVENIAIKTQIRADGSFQAVGLPHAAKYGVYFPYDFNGPTESIPNPLGNPGYARTGKRCVYTPTQCPFDTGSSQAARCDGDPSPALKDCCSSAYCESNYLQSTPFRWPINSDGIQDVFGYQQVGYPQNVATALHDQLGNVVNLNNPGRTQRLIFITSANRLDLVNHVNVFPVIPTSVLKFKVNNRTTRNGDGTAANPASMFNVNLFKNPVTVTAQRIQLNNKLTNSFPVPGIQTNYVFVDGPVITGKTTADGDFQAFAPPGIYLLTYSLDANYFGVVYRSVEPYTGPFLEWSRWSNPIVNLSPTSGSCLIPCGQPATLGPSPTPACDPAVVNGCNIDCSYLYLYLFYKPLFVWGAVTRAEKGTMSYADQEITLPEVVPNSGRVSIYVESDRSFEGLPHKWLACMLHENRSTNCCEVAIPQNNNSKPANLTDIDFYDVSGNILMSSGLYLFRAQGVTSSIRGKIRFVDYALSHPTDLANLATNNWQHTPPAICGTEGSGATATHTQLCEDQEQEIFNAAGVVRLDLPLVPKPNEGLRFKVLDAAGNQTIGAKLSAMPKTDPQGSYWISTKQDAGASDTKGELVIPFSAFLPNGSGGGQQITQADFKQDFIVNLNIGDNIYNGSVVIPAQFLSDVYAQVLAGNNTNTINPLPTECPKSINSNLPYTYNLGYNCFQKDGTYLITIYPKATNVVTGGTSSSGLIWLAGKTKLKPPPVFAAVNNITYCDTAGEGITIPGSSVLINGKGMLRLNGSLNSKIEDKVIAAFIESDWYKSTTNLIAPTRVLEGIKYSPEVGGRDVWLVDNKNGVEDFYYDDMSGKFTLFLPCGTTRWKISFESGDRIANSSNVGEETNWSNSNYELTDAYLGTFSAPSTTSTSLTTQERSVLVRAAVLGDNRSKTEQFEVAVKGTGVEQKSNGAGADSWFGVYTIDPGIISGNLMKTCPAGIELGKNLWHQFISSVTCNVGYAFSQMVPKVFKFLENEVLTTKPLVETAAVVILWNLMRNITNLSFVVVMMVLGIMIILHFSTKDFNPFHFLIKVIKAVFMANFSLVICQFFIDINNILVHVTFSTINSAIMSSLGDPTQYSAAAYSGIAAAGSAIGTSIGAAAGAAASLGVGALGVTAPGIGIMIVLFFVFLGASLLFVALGVLLQFILRYAIIWLCVILAPFNFLLSPLPFGKTFTGLWSKTFMAFTFMQTAIAILLALGMALMTTFPIASGGNLGIVEIGQMLIAIAIVGISLRAPSTVASLMGAGQGAQLMAGLSKGAQSLGQGVAQTFTPEEMGRRKGAYEMESTAEVVKRGGLKRQVWNPEKNEMETVGSVSKGKARLIGAAAMFKQFSGVPLFQKRAIFKDAEAKGIKGRLAEEGLGVESKSDVRETVAKDMFEKTSAYEQAAYLGVSVGGAQNIYNGLRNGAVNNPNAEVRLLDAAGKARELQAPEAKAYEAAVKKSETRLSEAETELKSTQASGDKASIETAMAKLAEQRKTNDLLMKMISKDTDTGNYRMSGLDGKGTWQLGDFRRMAKTMWEDPDEKEKGAKGFGADFIRANVTGDSGKKLLPLGETGILPAVEVVRNWMGSKVYGQQNVASEDNRQGLTKVATSQMGSWERTQLDKNPVWRVQRTGAQRKMQIGLTTHPTIMPTLPSEVSGVQQPGADFKQETFQAIETMLRSKDFMYSSKTSPAERDSMYRFLSRGHQDAAQPYSPQELAEMKNAFLTMVQELAPHKGARWVTEEE